MLDVVWSAYLVATVLAVVVWWAWWFTEGFLEASPFLWFTEFLGGTIWIAIFWPIAIWRVFWR